MVRILQIVPNMHRAGLESLLMNVYRNIDRSRMQFDFLVHYSGRYDYDDEIESLGGKIYHFPVMEDKNVPKYFFELVKFFRTHKEYKVIHGHMPSLGFIYMTAAKIAGVPVRAMHSHDAGSEKNLKGRVKSVTIKFAKYPSTCLFACSEKAGAYQYGKTKFRVMQNGIEADKFRFNSDVRRRVRERMCLDGRTVILNIARFFDQKNHAFILEIFEAYLKLDSSALLLLVGDGELMEKTRRTVKEKGLTNHVRFLGVRDDVPDIYQAADLFLLPSLHEGLPLVGIEAQAAGLISVMSDEITKEVDITGNIRFISLSRSAEYWAKQIDEIIRGGAQRQDTYEKICGAGYDARCEAKKIQRIYQKLYDGA